MNPNAQLLMVALDKHKCSMIHKQSCAGNYTKLSLYTLDVSFFEIDEHLIELHQRTSAGIWIYEGRFCGHSELFDDYIIIDDMRKQQFPINDQ